MPIFCSVKTSALADKLRIILPSYSRVRQTLQEHLDELHIALPTRQRLVRYSDSVRLSTHDGYDHR